MNNEILYKYRSLQNWKFLLDIFLNKRLYAAMYKELNDPMEGRYYYQNDLLSREFKRTVSNQKREWKICSLSKNYLNTLMWSYYADGHRGIAIGIKVDSKSSNHCLTKTVRYPREARLNDRIIQQHPEQVALHILSQKQSAWKHEDEVRIFTHERFVKIEIQQVYLGCLIEDLDCELITQLVKVVAPKAKVIKLERRQLDQPINQFQMATNKQGLLFDQ